MIFATHIAFALLVESIMDSGEIKMFWSFFMSNKRKYLVSTAILLTTLGSAYQVSAEAADVSNNSSEVVIVQNEINEKMNHPAPRGEVSTSLD